MNTWLEDIDPEWAWDAYTPSTAQPWTRSEVAHLYRRAGFAANHEQLKDGESLTPLELVDRLLQASEPDEYRAEVDDVAQAMLATGKTNNLSAWWLYRMLGSPCQALEKTTLFWHGHFATSGDKVTNARMMMDQNRILREFALGDFGQMVHRISSDPAMLIYLDSVTNRKAHPNENFARELMELFCLGEGNYKEKDIQELARCFTGWEVRRDRFRFNRYQHDGGTKTILGRTGEFDGKEGVDVVLDNESVGPFIAAKLVRYYLFDEPRVSDNLVQPLAQQFRDEGLQVGPLVRRMLSSNLMFSEWSRGAKVRSPVELAVGMLRAMDGTTDTYWLAEEVKNLGQGLFYPPNVKGWDGGRNWINSSTLLGRANLIRNLLRNEKTRFGAGTLVQWLKQRGASEPSDVVHTLEELLLAVTPPQAVHEQLLSVAAEQGKSPDERVANVMFVLGALPEFQLG
jgi:uncharacterized protein (DUF1800 family)